MTSAKMSPAYSRSPCSPRALSASSSPGGAHGPGGLSRRLGEALLPAGTSSGAGTLAGSALREAAGICWGEGPGSEPGEAGSETPAPAAHQHPSGWRWGPNREPTSSRWSQDSTNCALNEPGRMHAEHDSPGQKGRCAGMRLLHRYCLMFPCGYNQAISGRNFQK